MPDMPEMPSLSDALDMRDTPHGVLHWQDRQYRLQGLGNAMATSAALQEAKRGNTYMQVTWRLAEQAAAGLRRATAAVVDENNLRLAALKRAIQVADGEIVEKMSELIRQKMGRWSKELPDELAAIFLPNARTMPLLKRQSAKDRLMSFADPAAALMATGQKIVDLQTKPGAVPNYLAGASHSGFVTDFSAASTMLAAPYVEQFFLAVANKLDEKLRPGHPNHTKLHLEAVMATAKLMKAVPLVAKLEQVLEIQIPNELLAALKDITTPVDTFLHAIVVKLMSGDGLSGVLKAVSNVHTVAMPFGKLIQPLIALVSLLRKYPKIDAMHALYQRLPAGGPCREAAFQIADKWETGLVNSLGGGNHVYAFINAIRGIYNAGKNLKAPSPARTLWAAAQDQSPVSARDRADALLVLATLFGGGNADKGIEGAVAAIVSDQVSGVARISSLI